MKLMLTGLLLLFASSLANAHDRWHLAKEGDGIQVWKRKDPNTTIADFKAEIIVNSTLSGLLSLFYDADAAPNWLDHTRKVEIINRNDPIHSYTLHIETSMPWPTENRDAVLQGYWNQDPKTLTVYLHGHSISYQATPGFIRASVLSDWTFVPLGDHKVKVIMSGHTDLEGHIPDWTVNMLLQESPYTTLENLRQRISLPVYQSAHIDGIIEPGEVMTERNPLQEPR